VGEQRIRTGAQLELMPDGFYFGWDGRNRPIALRSPTLTHVAAGLARVDWVADNDRLRAWFSQDHGQTWRAMDRGVYFDVSAGSLEVLFVDNDGVDSDTHLSSVTIHYPAFERRSGEKGQEP
jgi:hypothetical protein